MNTHSKAISWLAATGLLAVATGLSVSAQPFSIDWYKVAGGGGTSTSSLYSLSGTIGQPDASAPVSGGNYVVTGGFWALYAVQTPGTPTLLIRQSAGQAVVYWDPTASGYTLQTNANLTLGAWGNYLGPVVNNSATNAPPKGTVFFRLKQ